MISLLAVHILEEIKRRKEKDGEKNAGDGQVCCIIYNTLGNIFKKCIFLTAVA